MAYIKERGNNNYFVRASYGILENGRPFQKSRLFRPSRVNLPESKVRKELDAFVKALEEECRIEFELKHQHKPNVDFDETEAAQVLAEVAEAQESQPVLTHIQTPSTPLFSDFCSTYLTAKKENISSTTYLLYETAIQRILIPKLGHLHLDEIKPFHVQELINFLATPSGRVDKKGEKLAPATIRRYLTILQSIMTMAWKQEYISSNPADTRRLEISKIVTPEVEAFSNEEIAEILQMARLEPIHIHSVIATAIYTGARRGEIAGLKWEDVDFENRTMYIRRSVVKLVGQEPEIKLPKTISSIRQMAIPQALCDILLELKKEQDRKKALLGEKWHETGFIFTDWCGHVMHPHTPTKQFDKFLKKYGFRHLKFHGLRHSSATYLLSNGCDIKTVSKRLGHTSIDTTNIYVHALAKTDKAAADCFDSIDV
jgi:integrase